MRLTPRLYALFFLTFLAVPDAVLAQAGSIVGRVVDRESGRAITNARVEAIGADSRAVTTALTNTDGRYRLNVAPGVYTVSVESLGYELTLSDPVTVAAGATATADISVSSAAFQLNPVVVSASRRQEKATEAPSRVEVVTEREIAERPAVTLVDHLRSTPGVDVITTGVQSTNVSVRGFNNIFSGSLHTLTDNRIAGLPSLRVNLMHFVPQTNEDIARMEVVLGPGSALYGPNTANGVLHIITKSPLNETGTTVSFSGGERSTLHGTFRTAQRLSDNFGVKVSGQYLQAEEWAYFDDVELAARQLARSTDPQDQARFRSQLPLDVDGTPLSEAEIQSRIARIGERNFDIMRWSGDVRADWRVTDDLTTVFSAGLTSSGKGIELTGIGAGQVEDWRYGYYQARANWRRVFAQAYLNTSDAGETFFLRTGAPVVDRSKVFVSQFQNGFNLRGWQDFTYGMDFIRTMPDTERTIHGANEDDDTFSEFGAYVQSRTTVTPKLSLVLAGRGDRHSELDKWVFSPRAALVFSPADDQSLRLSYNRAFSTPSSLNLFLDIDGGPAPAALGSLGYRIRAQGPGSNGFSFRGSDGTLHGMRSPFAAGLQRSPTDMIEINSANLYHMQITGFFAAAAAQGQPIPGELQAYMRSLAADPTLGTVTPLLLDPLNPTQLAPLSSMTHAIPGTQESRSESIELGYKGVIGGKLMLAADAWFERRDNFVSPLILQTPLTLLNPEALAGFLIPRLTPVVGAAQAQAIAENVAQIPGGVVSSPDINAAGADLLVTYRNFGEVEISGLDVTAAYLLTDELQIGATVSLVSDYYFTLPLEGAADQPVALNAPKEKGSATLTYRSAARGLNGELRVRHNGEFPANSADYIGLECIPGNPGTGPCVQSYTLVDLNLGYRLPNIRGASVQLNISNLFDEAYQSFIGVASVGRLSVLRLKYEF